MTRPVTIITGQFGDVPSEELFPKMAAIGYDGLELACGSEHFDVKRCLHAPAYWPAKRAQLEKYGLKCWALSNHCVGQGVCDLIDQRNLDVIPEDLRDSDPERVWRLCAEEMKETARAASMIGAKVVTGFTGSSIWRYLYSFPPVPQVADDLTYEEAVSTALAEGRDPLKIDWIRAGFELFKERWNPILDAFDECGVKFALEVHPTEIAFDLWSAETALDMLDGRRAFGFNFDPSHLIWQQVDPVKFIRRFSDRIYHVHMKDAALQLDGENGVLGSHLPFGSPKRGWEFRSLGRGHVNFEEIIRALNDIDYDGPLSVEWEDQRMDRWYGARESYEYVKKIDFPKNVDVVFNAQFAK